MHASLQWLYTSTKMGHQNHNAHSFSFWFLGACLYPPLQWIVLLVFFFICKKEYVCLLWFVKLYFLWPKHRLPCKGCKVLSLGDCYFCWRDNVFYTEDMEMYWSHSNMLAIPCCWVLLLWTRMIAIFFLQIEHHSLLLHQSLCGWRKSFMFFLLRLHHYANMFKNILW